MEELTSEKQAKISRREVKCYAIYRRILVKLEQLKKEFDQRILYYASTGLYSIHQQLLRLDKKCHYLFKKKNEYKHILYDKFNYFKSEVEIAILKYIAIRKPFLSDQNLSILHQSLITLQQRCNYFFDKKYPNADILLYKFYFSAALIKTHPSSEKSMANLVIQHGLLTQNIKNSAQQPTKRPRLT